MTTALTITSQVVTSLNVGLKTNLHLIATATNALGNRQYQLAWSVYENDTMATKVLAIFKDNAQIIPQTTVTLSEGIEASTTSLLQALKDVLETAYGWTITEVTQ
jgi:hypothetical protein